jgi:exonuclease VII large subunit
MSEETLDKDLMIASLLESVENLREEIQQVRNNNRILRRVHSALRSANTALRNRVEMAEKNDELFKQFCNGDFDAKVTSPAEGGLPEAGTQVDSLG